MVARGLVAVLCMTIACASHPAKQKAGPSLAIETEVWSFGTMERGRTATGTVSIANVGRDTLRLRLYSTCDCLSARPEQARIPAGKKLTIDLSYMGDEIEDPVTKTVFMDSNDPERPRLAFKITGTVTPGRAPHLVAIPAPLPLDPAAPAYPQAELRLENRGEETLKIDEVTCFGCINAWSQKVLAGGEEAVLDVTPLPDWTDRRWIEIKSNDPVQPLKRITIVELD
jgi:hypothetical protein